MTGHPRSADTASSRRDPCLACGHAGSTAVDGWQGRLALAATDRLRRCPSCGLGWLARADGETTASYEDTYFTDYAASSMPGGVDAVPPHVDERLDAVRRLLGRPGAFLDVGCGFGNVLHAARERGWQAQGLDVSEWGAEHVRRTRGIPVTVGDVLAVDFAPASFDVIHMSHALEHMTNPRAVLLRIRQWLRPGGVVLIEVPNQMNELYADVRWRLMGRFVPPPVANSHEFFFTAHSLGLMLRATGYDTLQLRTERRNHDRASRIPLGTVVKGLLYDVERRLARGPNIVAWARATTDAR